MSSYAEVATSPRVLAPVIQQLGLRTTPKELAESVEATVPVDTVILEIAATDPDPTRAAEIANAVGQELAKAAADLSPQKEDGTKAVQATTIAAGGSAGRGILPQDPPKSRHRPDPWVCYWD